MSNPGAPNEPSNAPPIGEDAPDLSNRAGPTPGQHRSADAGRPSRPSRSRRSRRTSGDDREAAILATAERLLGQRTVHELAVDDLARGAGISRPTFYFYFPSKEAVVLTLLDQVVDEARAVRDQALADHPDDPPGRWRRALEATHRTFERHRSLTLAAAQLQAGNEEARTLWRTVMEGFVEDTAAAIESDRRRGLAPPGPDARELAVALNWMAERVIFTTIAGQGPSLDPSSTVDVLLSVWLRAIYGRIGED